MLELILEQDCPKHLEKIDRCATCENCKYIDHFYIEGFGFQDGKIETTVFCKYDEMTAAYDVSMKIYEEGIFEEFPHMLYRGIKGLTYEQMKLLCTVLARYNVPYKVTSWRFKDSI